MGWGAVLAGDALVPRVTKARSGAAIAVPIILSQTIVESIVRGANHARACLLNIIDMKERH